jgi:hypothetical protein
METGGTTPMVTARFPARRVVKMKTTSLLPIKMDEIEFSHSRRLY